MKISKESNKKETIEVMETVLFTDAVKQKLNQCKMSDVAPFLGIISDLHNIKDVIVTPCHNVLCKSNEGLEKVKDLFTRMVQWN